MEGKGLTFSASSSIFRFFFSFFFFFFLKSKATALYRVARVSLNILKWSLCGLLPIFREGQTYPHQAESTEAGIGGKPCDLKRLEERPMVGGKNLCRVSRDLQVHHPYGILLNNIRSLVFRSNLSNNIKSHFIISNDGNDDNNNNDNYKLWTLIGYLL